MVQPTKMFSKTEIAHFSDASAEFCMNCEESEENCSNCILNKFLEFIRPKAFILINKKRVWLNDDSGIMFIYNDGSKSEYIITVIDCTHVELCKCEGNQECTSTTLHILQLESMIQEKSVKKIAYCPDWCAQNWVDFADFVSQFA